MKFSYYGYFITIYFAFIICSFSYGQTTVKGEIIDASTNEPLIGASIVVKGTSTGTVTDFDGTFEFKTDQLLPFFIVVSYTGFQTEEVEVSGGTEPLFIQLEEGVFTTDVIEVKGQRISEKQKASPLTVESLDLIAIKQTPADNFYDGLGNLKGVDLTAASLGFKVINTRGFNSTSPVRSLQIIDGVDNQAPGLNFSLGNFLGAPDLDVLKVDLVQGASSAYYGPGAFNGVINMTTKNPFYQEGLSAMVKAGERNMLMSAIRWADVINNKDGLPFIGYKINASYLSADDWVADNYDPTTESERGRDNPGRFDGVNIYGDEYYNGLDYSTASIVNFPGLDLSYRTGYREEDLVDYDTRNTKANAAIHIRTNPSEREASPELILAGNYGSGTTVYQGDNRFSLKNIQFGQARVEYRKEHKFFLRAYGTWEDAGDSYDPFFTALALLDSAKTDFAWSVDYVGHWQNQVTPAIQNEEGWPEFIVMVDPVTGAVTTSFDIDQAEQWLVDNQDKLQQWHQEASDFANQANKPSQNAFYEPGTARFEEKFNEITTKKRTEGGTLFTDKSALYHVHGEYTFEPQFLEELKLGANFRMYTPSSEGTIFYDTAGINITNSEFGIYTGASKSILDKKLTFSATIRMDKNENFDYLFSPAASIVFKPSSGNFLRASFSSALRNPTLTDQYLSLNVGPAILAGNLDGVKNLVTVESLLDYVRFQDQTLLNYFDIDPIRPEQVRTFELGYRTTLFNQLYLDAGYYYNIYEHFIGFNIGARIAIDQSTGFLRNAQVYRYSANSTNKVTTQGFALGANWYFQRYFMLSGNYSWNRLNKTFDDDPIIPAFNTPEHKFNIGISGRDVPIQIGGKTFNNFGFNINYKWIEGFTFEGSPQFSGFIPTYDLLDAQVNYNFKKINTTVKIGASNVLNNKQFQTYGGPRIGRLAYASLLFELD